MMSIEEDQLMASLARLDLRLREKPTGDRPQVPALPASRHPRSANDQAKGKEGYRPPYVVLSAVSRDVSNHCCATISNNAIVSTPLPASVSATLDYGEYEYLRVGKTVSDPLLCPDKNSQFV